MNIVTTCIGELPEELREATIKEQRERRRNVNIYYPFLSDECAEALKDELMLIIWSMECSEATLYMVAVYEKPMAYFTERESKLSHLWSCRLPDN